MDYSPYIQYLEEHWQQIELAGANIGFAALMIPQMKDKNTKVNRRASKFTSYLLILNAFTFTTLHYYFTAVTSAIVGLMWNWLSEHRVKNTKLEEVNEDLISAT